ncbi:ATP-binding protein, partial [Elusimicrobiota bacterium]
AGSGEGAGGFGALIKKLVEDSVADPRERARIYTDAVRGVKQAIARRVSEATRELRVEKQQVTNERDRTEQVLSTAAVGKVVVDREGKILMLDPAAEEIVGKKLVEVAGKPLLESVNADEHMATLAKDMELKPGDEPTGKVKLAGEGEAAEALRRSLAVVQDESGRVVGTYGVLPDVAKFKEALRLQDEFVAHVTHELKAPLSAICSAIDLIDEMGRAKRGTQEQRFLDISKRNTLRLRQMIEEILDFSKIKSGAMTVNPAPVNIAKVVSEAAEGLGPWASSRGIDIEVKVEGINGRDVTVMADYGRVVQVLTNLISNGIKAIPEKGKITLNAAPGTGDNACAMVVSVKDTGRGISAANREKIFERFQQVSSNGARPEGVGLGLHIVKELVGLHKGRLWLESEEGQGSTFFFTLPLAP